MFKLQSPTKYSPFDAIHLSGHFFYHSKQSSNSSILVHFSSSDVFCFTSSTSENVSLWGLFPSGGTKKKSLGQDQVNREGREWGSHAIFGQKLLNTQHSVGRCTCKSPIMKQANMLKESSKKIHWRTEAASHNNSSWYTDADRFLEPSSSGGSLYDKGPAIWKIIPIFGGSPLIAWRPQLIILYCIFESC